MRSRVPAFCALAVLAGCTSEYPNPFARQDITAAIPAGADILYTSNTWSARTGGGREVFSVEDTGAGVTRLTACNTEQTRCDSIEAAPGPDRRRAAVRRVLDTDGDGRLSATTDGEALMMVDFARGVEGSLVAANGRVSGVDWYPGQELLFYSAAGSGAEDLYQISTNGQTNQNLTQSLTVRERRPRFNSNATGVAYERIDAAGKGTIWIASAAGSRAVTTGGAGTAALPSTPYVVGSDADASFSPDNRRIVFRRLMAAGNDDVGQWHIMTALTDGTDLLTIVSGPAFRGAPDWGPAGIVFTEALAGGPTQLVVVGPDGTGRRVLTTAGAGFELTNPRWLGSAGS